MRVLIIGSGGREHALVWKIASSPLVSKVYCAPGNAGIAGIAECVNIKAENLNALVEFASDSKIDLTIVGPEAPLIAGIVDLFEAAGLPVFGPSSGPARIEGSKVFSKSLMQSAGIPTAAFWICATPAEAKECVQQYYSVAAPDTRLVIKADGLAAGKGVVVASNNEDAYRAIDRFMEERVFGSSGDMVVVEECLTGEEASIMAITDGRAIVPLLPAQDYKRALDGDAGPNTGGMGAYCPVPVISNDIVQFTVDRIIRPAVLAIRDLGIPYRGALYAGIMITPDGPKCIEFNCRLGDPETQAVLPMLKSDLVPLLMSVIDGSLDDATTEWSNGASVCVVAASEGYPDSFDPGRDVSAVIGRPISGLEEASALTDCLVFHSGTRLLDDGATTVTSGGRVLSVTGFGEDLLSAAGRAYGTIDKVTFAGMQYRKDIAARALQ